MIEKIICWIIAIPILLLCGFGWLENGNPPILLTACGLLFIPRVFNFAEEILEKKISRWLKYPVLVVLFVVGLIYFDGGGSHRSYDDSIEKCSFCYGEGEVTCNQCNGLRQEQIYLPTETENGLQYIGHKGHYEYVNIWGNHYANFPCFHCNKTGKVKCSYCDGSGHR